MVCNVGALLDPRFKKSWIKLSGYAEADILSAVREELQARYRIMRESEFLIYNFSISLLMTISYFQMEQVLFRQSREKSQALPRRTAAQLDAGDIKATMACTLQL